MPENLSKLHVGDDWQSFLSFRSRRLAGVQTGIRDLDQVLLGLGGVVVIQGAPGCNKSTLALQVAVHQAQLGNPSLVVDRENGRERFRMRLLCMTNRRSTTDILTCRVDELRSYVNKVRNLPLYVDNGEPTPEDLRTKVQNLASLAGSNPFCVVVDSLQALPALGADERVSLQNWMKALDQLKLDYEGRLTVLVTSEKSRGTEGANYERAALGAGKGTGGIEYKAEQVLDLRRSSSGTILCKVVKNRDGIVGAEVELLQQLATPGQASSFCFKLGGVSDK